jgi:tRNA-splicing ligase RtcB
MRIFKNGRIPIKSWSNDPEEGALHQAVNLADLPFTFQHIALMPDVHQGFGMPIGGVTACKDHVIPNAVGVDIGCGMAAVRTSVLAADVSVSDLKNILGDIRRTIPLGFEHHNSRQDERLMPRYKVTVGDYPVVNEEYASALTQIGTLGGGNHFIELQKDTDGYLWFMIHSGSRNLGKKVADHHNRIARRLNEKEKLSPPAWDLAALSLDTDEAETYLREMSYCLDFARANRKLMTERIKEILQDRISTKFPEEIDIHHNYAQREEHFGEKVMLHRKGATSARKGEAGIVPGSQGTPSYIILGKGNTESFQSCAHGAGRKMGREQAKRSLDLAEEQRKLDEKGILHSLRSKRDLDEAASAYKDIDAVMNEQRDLVDIRVKLEPLGVIKG